MSSIKIGLIGGSGLGQALLEGAEGQRHEVDTPFGRPSDAIVEAHWEGLPVLLLGRHGPGHVLNPSQIPFRANIFALKQLGCTHIIASGAVGSLRQEFAPKDLVIVDQVIDKTQRRPGTFYEKAAVHVEFAEPFCPVLRQILIEEGAALSAAASASPLSTGENPAGALPVAATGAGHGHKHGFSVHDRGCYVCMEGPAFSSRAESLMHRLWGGDLIGMTAMPEAKLAREAEIPYALIALVTDYDCWKQPTAVTTPKAGAEYKPEKIDPFALLNEIIGNLKSATDQGIQLMRKALARIAKNPEPLADCHALYALQLGIWSDKSRIDPEEVKRLGPLWGKYFA
jgi:5'-methylthioadenosine phosphorylase